MHSERESHLVAPNGSPIYRGLYRTSIIFSLKKDSDFQRKNPRYFFGTKKRENRIFSAKIRDFFWTKKISDFCTENPSGFFSSQNNSRILAPKIRVFYRPNKNLGFLHRKSEFFFRPKKISDFCSEKSEFFF